jgi:hypothetical protein
MECQVSDGAEGLRKVKEKRHAIHFEQLSPAGDVSSHPTHVVIRLDCHRCGQLNSSIPAQARQREQE